MNEKNDYGSPQNLKKEKIYNANFLVEIPDEEKAKVEFFSLHSVQEFTLVELLKTPQNRYWIYQKFPYTTSAVYPFRFKFFDMKTKSLFFSPFRKKLLSQASVKQIFSSKKELSLRKGRLLSACRKGWKCSINGDLKEIYFRKKRIPLKKNKNYRRKKGVKPLSLFFSISLYGKITNFTKMSKPLVRFKKRKRRFRIFKSYPKNLQKLLKGLSLNFLKKKKKDVLKKLIGFVPKKKKIFNNETRNSKRSKKTFFISKNRSRQKII